MDFIDQHTNDKDATMTAQVQLRYIRSARGDDILRQTGEAPTMVTKTMQTTRDLFDTHQPLIDAVHAHSQWQKRQAENAQRQAEDARQQLLTDTVEKVDTINTQIQALQQELATNATVAQSTKEEHDMRHQSMLAIVSKQSEKHKLHEAGLRKLQPMVDDLSSVQQKLATLTTGVTTLTTGVTTATSRLQDNEHLLRGIDQKFATFEHTTAKATVELQNALLTNTTDYDAKRTADKQLAATAIVELEERTASATSELQEFIRDVESKVATNAPVQVQQPAAEIVQHIHDKIDTLRGNTAKATIQLQQSLNEVKETTAHSMQQTTAHSMQQTTTHSMQDNDAVPPETKKKKNNKKKKKATGSLPTDAENMSLPTDAENRSLQAATEVENALSQIQSASKMSEDVITRAEMAYTPAKHPMRDELDKALCRIDAIDKTHFDRDRSTKRDKELEYRENRRVLEDCANRCIARPNYCASADASSILHASIQYMDAIDKERECDELIALDRVQRLQTMNGIEEMNHDI